MIKTQNYNPCSTDVISFWQLWGRRSIIGHKYNFCRDKHDKRQQFCRGKHTFVATNDVFRVLVTKIILVAAPTNDTEEGALPSTPEVAYRETEFTSSLKVGTVSQGKARFHRWRRRLEAMHRELNAC